MIKWLSENNLVANIILWSTVFLVVQGLSIILLVTGYFYGNLIGTVAFLAVSQTLVVLAICTQVWEQIKLQAKGDCYRRGDLETKIHNRDQQLLSKDHMITQLRDKIDRLERINE